MSPLRCYYRYKWYSQAARSLQRQLMPYADEASTPLNNAQQCYNDWLRYYAYVTAEQQGRISFRDDYVPQSHRDDGHEHQIRRCEVGSRMAYQQLTRWGQYCHRQNELQGLEESITSLASDELDVRQNHTDLDAKRTQDLKRKQKTSKMLHAKHGTTFSLEEVDDIIAQIQSEAEQVEVQACIDVARLILTICPSFSARDPLVPDSIDFVAMSEILLLNRECCRNGEWTKNNFLKNYDPQRLCTTIEAVDSQYLQLRRMKGNHQMRVHLPSIERLVQFILDLIRKNEFTIVLCTTSGNATKANLTRFLGSAMEELMITLVHKTLEANDDVIMVNISAQGEILPRLHRNVIIERIILVYKEQVAIEQRSTMKAIQKAKAEQTAQNILAAILFCLRNDNVRSLLQVPVNSTTFFYQWHHHFRSTHITWSSLRRQLSDLNNEDLGVLEGITNQPRSRSSFSQLVRCLHFLSVQEMSH